MAIVELLAAVTPGEERNPELFALLVSALGAAESAAQNSVNAFFLFETRLLDLLGYHPEFNRCAGCGRSIAPEGEGEMKLEVARGGVYCPECARAGRGVESISPAAVSFLRRMQEVAAVDSVSRITLPPHLRGEVGTVLRLLLQSHVEGLKPLRSEGVFAALQGSRPLSTESGG